IPDRSRRSCSGTWIMTATSISCSRRRGETASTVTTSTVRSARWPRRWAWPWKGAATLRREISTATAAPIWWCSRAMAARRCSTTSVRGGSRTWRRRAASPPCGAPAGAQAATTATAVAVADIDQDGDLDLIVVGWDGRPRLLRNDGGNVNQYVDVRLVALRQGSGKNNGFGRGATVELRARDLYQLRLATDRVTHFGLGRRLKADVLRVRWPNGVSQTVYYPGTEEDVLE